ncbi:MAG: hypothetical protein ACLFSZ_10440 [Puniceicoccaceae bacterium]
MNWSQEILDVWKYVATFLTALTASYVLTMVMIFLGPRLGMIDLPDERRIHTRPIPRAGGVAVFFAFHLAVAACVFVYWPDFQSRDGFNWWLAFLAGSGVLSFVGYYDDSEGISAPVKLFAQFAAVNVFVFLSGAGVSGLLGMELPLWLDWALTVFWCLAIINAFNLIDGMDGLCAGLAVISGTGLIVVYGFRGMAAETILVLALVGATLGFLRFNFHPARIFLGDTGSMFIGFTLASMSIQAGGKSTLLVSIGIPLLAAGVPLFDTLLAIWRRSARRALCRLKSGSNVPVRIMGADKDHLHHRLLGLGLSQRRVALLLYAGNGFLVTVGLVSVLQAQAALGLLLIAFLIGVFVIVRHVAAIELWDTGYLIARGFRNPGRTLRVQLVYPIWDLLFLVFACALAHWLVEVVAGYPPRWGRFLAEVPYWVAPTFAGIFFAKTYNRVWSQAHFRDFLLLSIGLGSGALVGFAVSSLLRRGFEAENLVFGIVFLFLAQVGVFGVRTINHLFREWTLTAVQDQKGGYQDPKRNVLLYGAGDRGNLYLQDYRLVHPEMIGSVRVVGFIDDDPRLRRRRIHGSIVLGSSREIDKLVREHKVDELIILCRLREERLNWLIDLCRDLGIKLKVWNREEREVFLG